MSSLGLLRDICAVRQDSGSPCAGVGVMLSRWRAARWLLSQVQAPASQAPLQASRSPAAGTPSVGSVWGGGQSARSIAHAPPGVEVKREPPRPTAGMAGEQEPEVSKAWGRQFHSEQHLLASMPALLMLHKQRLRANLSTLSLSCIEVGVKLPYNRANLLCLLSAVAPLIPALPLSVAGLGGVVWASPGGYAEPAKGAQFTEHVNGEHDSWRVDCSVWRAGHPAAVRSDWLCCEIFQS